MVSETNTFYSCRSNEGYSLEFTAGYLDEGRRVQRSKLCDQDNIPHVNKVYFTVKVETILVKSAVVVFFRTSSDLKIKIFFIIQMDVERQ